MKFVPQGYEKETPTQVFSWDICEIFKNAFSFRTTPVAASEQTQEICGSLCGKVMLW